MSTPRCTIDKYAVVTDAESSKIASNEGRPCPSCGSKQVNYTGSTPHCPRCGVEPWEKSPHGSKKDFQR